MLPPSAGRAFEVPQGAEALLETRLPYLTAEQRRAVLASTALPAHVLIDGPEQWGRLDLFAAADGYGCFDDHVTVTMNAADGGFGAADSWRNDIGGRGSLTKAVTGALTLTGDNRYRGGTTVRCGTLVAASEGALGCGDVAVAGGSLVVAGTRVRGSYTQASGAVLEVTADREPALTVDLTVRLAAGSVLKVTGGRRGDLLPVLRTRRLQGRFGTVVGGRAVYTPTGVFVRLTR